MSLLDNKYAVLARRELWEHKSLWMAPVIVGGATVLLPLLGGVHVGARGVRVAGETDPATQLLLPGAFGQATMMGVTMGLWGIASLAVFAYLLDCLYGERKDRSILFWKSLPVSDAETVLAKLAVALVLTPLLVMLLALLVQPLLLGVLYARYEGMRPAIGFDSWVGGLRALPHVALAWLYMLLWYAPVSAWLLLSSVLARRAPLMYALMPPLALILLEGIFLQDNRVLTFIGQWLAPWARADWAWNSDSRYAMFPDGGSPDWLRLLANPALWAGLAVAAGMVYIVIRLRRYRDDT